MASSSGAVGQDSVALGGALGPLQGPTGPGVGPSAPQGPGGLTAALRNRNTKPLTDWQTHHSPDL